MTFLERTTDIRRLRHWEIDMSVDYIYTTGLAGERFFRALRDEGRVLAAHCPVCKTNQLPPRMFCERCFPQLTEYVDVPLEGRVAAVTAVHVDRHGDPLPAPEVFAFVRFKGITEGGLIHRFLGAADRARPGLSVQVKLKPKESRTGSILDIEGFEPSASQV